MKDAALRPAEVAGATPPPLFRCDRTAPVMRLASVSCWSDHGAALDTARVKCCAASSLEPRNEMEPREEQARR